MGHGWSAEADDPAAAGAVSPASSGAAAAAADLSHPSSPAREHDIFVSFRSDEGAEIIRNVTATFEPLGLKVFNPVLQLSDPSAEEMRRHVSCSRVCVVVITPKYFESKWCCIEALAAMEANVPIIPVYDGTKYLYAHGPPNDRNPMYWKAEHPGYHSLAKGDEGRALRNFVFRRNLLPATSDNDQRKATTDLIAALSNRIPALGHKLGPQPAPGNMEQPRDMVTVVVSCPETASLSGDAPYDIYVHEHCERLREEGQLLLAFDRPRRPVIGLREYHPDDVHIIWSMDDFRLDGRSPEEKWQAVEESVKGSMWFFGYRNRIKGVVLATAQCNLGKRLRLVCIKGGPIISLEHQEMFTIANQVERELEEIRVRARISVEYVSYANFAHEFP